MVETGLLAVVRPAGHTFVMASGDPAEMIGPDCVWAAELMHQRRETYASYSPVFWRPAPGATPLHAKFLQRQIVREDVVALRTDHGFAIGELRRGEGFIDDFAVDAVNRWQHDGRRILLAAWKRLWLKDASALRVVSANKDLPKDALLESLGLSPVEEWWVKPLTPSGHTATRGAVNGKGFSGHLGPAPPVYEPGGPLLVRRIDAEVPLAAIEREAASWGAVLAIVMELPSGPRTTELVADGYEVASQWFLGVPQDDRA